MTIDQLKARYFYLPADVQDNRTEPAPATFSDSFVTPLIDMARFSTELRLELAKIGTGSQRENREHFIYMANWWFHSPFSLDFAPAGKPLVEVLKEKISKGVEVRVMLWVSSSLMAPNVVGPDFESLKSINEDNLRTILALRGSNRGAAIANSASHPLGSSHLKIAILGNGSNSVAFTGGMDFEDFRKATPGHPTDEIWHDIQAKVQGKGVEDLFDTFRRMWNENVRRSPVNFSIKPTIGQLQAVPSHVDTSVISDQKQIPTDLPTQNPPVPRHHVQSLHTVPGPYVNPLDWLRRTPSVSWAPNGQFELKAAWKKAILAAQKYIYIEDQFFWSPEVMSWLNTALTTRHNLKIILVTSSGSDPNDPNFGDHQLQTAVDDHLLDGLSPDQIKARVRLLRIWGDTTRYAEGFLARTITPDSSSQKASEVTSDFQWPPDYPLDFARDELLLDQRLLLRLGNVDYPIAGHEPVGPGKTLRLKIEHPSGSPPRAGAPGTFQGTRIIVVHSKVTLVDDHWGLIGSGNVHRRSLFTDFEHGVAFLSEDGMAVKDLRKKLWSEHFNSGKPDDFDDLAAAVGAWDPSWNLPTSPPLPVRPQGDLGPPFIEPLTLPIGPSPTKPPNHQDAAAIIDPDSRRSTRICS